MFAPALLLSLSISGATLLDDASRLAATTTQPPMVAAPGLESGPRLLETVGGVARFRYRAKDGVPEGYTLVTQPRWDLIGAGIGALGGGYAGAAALAYFRSSALGLIPIAGPIVQLVVDWSRVSWSSGSWGAVTNFAIGFGMVLYSALAVVMTAAQVAGIVMIITGSNSPKHWLEKKTPAVELAVMPGSAAGPLGASVVGRF